MAKRKPSSKTRSTRAMELMPQHSPRGKSQEATEEAIKAAQEVALAAFASGLKIAAAFGTVAAKTTSFALESLATGADRFAELVKAEAMESTRVASPRPTRNRRSPPVRVEK